MIADGCQNGWQKDNFDPFSILLPCQLKRNILFRSILTKNNLSTKMTDMEKKCFQSVEANNCQRVQTREDPAL